jgi:hypothetical protein
METMTRPLPKYSIDVAALPDFGSKRSPSFSERFLSAVEHPAVATFAKVTFAGSVWFTGLAAAVVILLLVQGA